MKTSHIVSALIGFVICPSISLAQFPGDGLPDVYAVVEGGETFNTSVGFITRPIGTLIVDTDGNDMVALLIEGPDVTSPPDDGNWLAGSSAFLPDKNAGAPLFASNWTIGYIQGLNQYIRTNPLDTDGFIGVIGVYPDPFEIFPNLGLAPVGDPNDFIGNTVIFETSNMGGFDNLQVWPTPEPTTMSLVGMALLGLMGACRRSPT